MIVNSVVKPKEIIILKNKVFITSNITEIEKTLDGEIYTEYEYESTEYSKDEYIGLIVQKNAELESQIIETQLALCEIYEGVS
jgi:hypothetical protein